MTLVNVWMVKKQRLLVFLFLKQVAADLKRVRCLVNIRPVYF